MIPYAQNADVSAMLNVEQSPLQKVALLMTYCAVRVVALSEKKKIWRDGMMELNLMQIKLFWNCNNVIDSMK